MGGSSILAHPDEWPPRALTVGRFLIGAKEITFSEYDAFARSTGARLPDDFGWGRGQQPVVDVSWEDATAYAEWLSRQTGHRYRLPSEAEWEFAARGDSAKSYWWGYERGGGRAVCFDCGTQWDNRKTAPVASLAPNAFGLYDTAGNAMEWVSDCWSPDYTRAAADTRARTDGDCRSRVARGGAFNKTALAMRSAARNRFAPTTRINMLGFRVVREN
jgi:formylglycine-generating enzyme required for sulfatase activity